MAGPGDVYEYGHMWGGGYGFFGGFMMIAFWGIIIALIVVAVRWFNAKDGNSGSNALAILNERFAKGEIDEDEFKRRKAALES
jgi:putative membrane protein